MRNECGNEVIMAVNARIQVLAVGIELCDKCEFLEKLANANSGMVVGPGMDTPPTKVPSQAEFATGHCKIEVSEGSCFFRTFNESYRICFLNTSI